MHRRSLVALLTGVAVSGLALAGVPTATAAPPTAHLVHVHVFKAADAKGGGGKGGPPAPTTANCSPAQPTGNEYSTTGYGTAQQTVRFVTAGLPAVKTATNPASGPQGNASTSAISTAMQNSFTAWTNANHGAPTLTVQLDNSSTQTRQQADHTDQLLFGRTSGSIATTYTWVWTDGFIEHDVVFNSKLGWAVIPDTDSSAGGCYPNWPLYDVANIATHEFGHVYGLSHASSDRFETMYTYGYTGETLKRSPGNGDTLGINALY